MLIRVRAAMFVNMSIKSLKFRKEIRVRKIAIHDPDGIRFIQRSNQHIVSIFDGLHMTRSDVTSSAYKCKLLHKLIICMATALYPRAEISTLQRKVMGQRPLHAKV